MTLTGYPAEDLVLRESFADASRAALVDLAAALADEGLGDAARRRRLPATGAPDAVAATLGTPQGRAAERRRAAARRRGRRPLRQAPPAQLRRLRRGPLLRARHRAAVVAAARRRRRAGHLRGPLAGGRPVRRGRRGRRRPVRRLNASPVRAGQGRPAAAAGAPPGRRGAARRSPTATRSAARTSWSSTATRCGRRADGELLARAPQFVEHLLIVDLDLPGRHGTDRAPDGRIGADDASTGTCCPTSRCPPFEPRAGRGRRAAGRLREVWRALVLGPARLHRQERLPLGRARACPAASTRRWSPRSPSTRSAPTACTAWRCRRSTPPSTRCRRRGPGRSAPGCTTRVVPIAPMVDGVPRRRSS